MKYNSTGLPLRLREQVSGEIIDGGLSAIDIRSAAKTPIVFHCCTVL